MAAPSVRPSPEELLDKILEAAATTKAAEYEVYLVRHESMSLAAKEGRIDRVGRREELAAAVRLIDQDRLGFAYTAVFTPEAIRATVDQAAAGTRLADPQPELRLPDPPLEGYPKLVAEEPDTPPIPLSDKMTRVLSMERAALDLDRRIERVRQAEYHESAAEVWLANSHGLTYRHSSKVYSGNLLAKAKEGDQAEMGYEGDFSRCSVDLDLESIARKAAGKALAALGGRKIKGGRLAVILENEVVADFLGVLTTSFLADQVQKGKSLLAGRVGQPVAAAGVNLTDDGLYPGGLATAPADAEGTPRQRTILVKDGLLIGFLYDYPQARKQGTRSTGNAGRGGVGGPPSVSPTNFLMTPGQKTLPELTRELGQGLLVTEVLGLHTANPISGEFSIGVAGQRVSAGQVVHPVKGMALAGNILDMFRQAAAVGSDFRLFGAVGAPSLLVDGLTLSGL